MIALPLLLLSLAAGIYLLITVTREYMGRLFKVLAWLVILLSLLSIVAVTLHGIHHLHRMHKHRHELWLQRNEQGMPMGAWNGMAKDSVCPMTCCKMEGDSMVIDKSMCEKMMGKKACDSVCAIRGRCILSKEECTKLCGGTVRCMMDNKMPCCAGNGTGEMKECCKKK